MTQAELITAFRKETEDLIRVSVIDMFNIQYGVTNVTTGVNGTTVSFPVPYDLTTEDYEVKIFSALDAQLTDIVDAITITKINVTSFRLNTARDGTVRWSASRRLPKVNFFT